MITRCPQACRVAPLHIGFTAARQAPPTADLGRMDISQIPQIPTARQRLVAAGADDTLLDRQLAAGRLRAPYRGVLLDSAVPLDLYGRARAALATQGPEAAIGHETAAVLLGLRWCPAVWLEPTSPVHVVVPRDDAHRHRRGLRLHRALVPTAHMTAVGGLRCTSPARTLIDLARRNDARRLVVVQLFDGARRDGRCTAEDLHDAVEFAYGERFTARARDWVNLSCDGVDSPPETQLRLTLVDAGCAVEPDIRLRDHVGVVVARGDLGNRRLLLWGEYDGYEAHSERSVFRSDRVGDRWLERRGWQVMRFVDEDLRRPDRTVREWQAAVAAAPARIAAMGPRRSPEVAAAQRALGLVP